MRELTHRFVFHSKVAPKKETADEPTEKPAGVEIKEVAAAPADVKKEAPLAKPEA